MRFAVSMYLALDADSEDEARKIIDTIELNSEYDEHIFWNRLNTEMEEMPQL